MQAAIPRNLDLVVVTPSYGPDAELCADLNRSVLELTDDSVVHHILVPGRDRGLFRDLEGPRTVVHDVREFLPRQMSKIPGSNLWINGSHPWPPIRGWICQQLVKLSVAASFDTSGVLLMDSDMLLVRRTSLDSFMVNGVPALYRKPSAIHVGLPLHRRWHESARSLLGLPPAPREDLTDYVCWPCLWEPRLVRRLLARVEESTGVSWVTAVGSQLHFSEMILYGVYVDEVLGGAESSTQEMKSVVYSEEQALDALGLALLLAAATSEDLAVMISAKSGTDLGTRRGALTEFTTAIADGGGKG